MRPPVQKLGIALTTGVAVLVGDNVGVLLAGNAVGVVVTVGDTVYVRVGEFVGVGV